MKVVGRVGKNLWMRLEQWTPHQTTIELHNDVFLETLPFPVEFFFFFSHPSDHILLLRICLLLFQKFQKSSTISSASETVLLKVLPWCWKPGFKWCSVLRHHEQPLQHPWMAGAEAATRCQPCGPTTGLRSFSHSTCSLCFTQGNSRDQFFGLSFWTRFSCCNVLRRSAGTPSVLLFCYHQITVLPVGSLQWGSDIRPLSLECIGISAVVITWQGHS